MNNFKKNQNKAREKKKTNIILISVFIILGVVLGISINAMLGLIVAILPIVVIITLAAGKEDVVVEEELYKRVKDELAPKVINQYLPNSSYFPYEGIELMEYEQAEYRECVEHYESDNKIKYVLQLNDSEKLEVEFAEIRFKNDTNRFVGVLGIIDLDNDIRTKIKINKEGACDKDYCFKFNVNNEEFENAFDVVSLNKKMASQILTEDIVSKIMEFYRTYRYNTDINIIRNKMYIRIESGDIIVNSNEGAKIDRNIMEKRYVMIKSILSVIELMYKRINDLGE